MPKIILASASIRRKQLLKQLIGNKFQVKVSKYPEDNTIKLSPRKLAMYHAQEKGRDVAKQLNTGIVISADTIVACRNKILGKPINDQDAKRMLQLQSGRTVQVITGLTVIDVQEKKEYTDYEITQVTMSTMTDTEIEAYIKTHEGKDKAGAFAVQGKGALFIKKIEGDYFNVVGLPLYKLGKMLQKVGIKVLDSKSF